MKILMESWIITVVKKGEHNYDRVFNVYNIDLSDTFSLYYVYVMRGLNFNCLIVMKHRHDTY